MRGVYKTGPNLSMSEELGGLPYGRDSPGSTEDARVHPSTVLSGLYYSVVKYASCFHPMELLILGVTLLLGYLHQCGGLSDGLPTLRDVFGNLTEKQHFKWGVLLASKHWLSSST